MKAKVKFDVVGKGWIIGTTRSIFGDVYLTIAVIGSGEIISRPIEDCEYIQA